MELSTYAGLATGEIGDFAPKPTSYEGDQLEASRSFFRSEDGLLDVGVWECTPGRFTADRTQSSEVCHIIFGVVEMRRDDGEIRRLTAGDLLVLPKGWKGVWHIVEQTRKLYVVQKA